MWKDDNDWQDGYTGQETVIINDFRGGIKYAVLLQLIDKWPAFVSRRGREPAPFLAKHVIITIVFWLGASSGDLKADGRAENHAENQ